MTAKIIYRPNAQKTPGLFDSLLNYEIFRDICVRVTGQESFEVIRDTSTYNKGRLICVIYNGVTNYISLSENDIKGRNSSLQSVPTAINLFYAEANPNKRLFYYFMPHIGNAFTDYHLFIYKLLITAGVVFLNMADYYPEIVLPYTNIDDLIADRRDNKKENSSNNSSYVSKTIDKIQIYAKTFGASKYESTLLAIAVSHIADKPIELFNICEQDLKVLPESSVATIEKLGNITMHYTSFTLDKRQYLEQSNKSVLRSPTYQYNLLNRIGHKKCALCGCEIPEIIQGAHIWGVAEIAKSTVLSEDDKFMHAISGHNGLWLCQNHHKLFDSNIIMLDTEGHIKMKKGILDKNILFINGITNVTTLLPHVLSDEFKWYISQRNQLLNSEYTHLLSV